MNKGEFVKREQILKQISALIDELTKGWPQGPNAVCDAGHQSHCQQCQSLRQAADDQYYGERGR